MPKTKIEEKIFAFMILLIAFMLILAGIVIKFLGLFFILVLIIIIAYFPLKKIIRLRYLEDKYSDP